MRVANSKDGYSSNLAQTEILSKILVKKKKKKNLT